MRAFSLIKAGIVLCIFFLSVPLHSFAEDWRWSGVDRVIAVADIHGAYDAFVELLKSTDIINDKLDWGGQKAHLVIIGDVLDRGSGSRKVLELIMKLESQADDAGGKVHMVLGNHEVMNLLGDLAYVSRAEFTSYSDDEDKSDREAALARFRKLTGKETADEDTLTVEFNKKYPDGFFGHRKLFSANGRFAQWLIDKPVLLQINDTVFVHGGLSGKILGTDGNGINHDYVRVLRQYLENWDLLSTAEILPVEADFYDHGQILKEYLAQVAAGNDRESGNITESAKLLLELNSSTLFQPDSVIWYRGSAMCNEILAEDELNATLQRLEAQRLVIGHTPTYNRMVLKRFEGRLIRADTGMLKSYYGGRPAAVIIEHDKLSVLYAGDKHTVEPLNQPRQTGIRPGILTDDELESLLTEAPIRESNRQNDGTRIIRLDYNGTLLDALFLPAVNKRKNRVFIPEVAAYRLDRLLGVDMVPVTVARNLDGEPGAVTLIQDELTSELKRQETRQGGNAWCPLGEQFNLMYVFDILSYNEGRTFEEIRYTPGEWHLVLTGNRKLFAPNRNRPRYLNNTPVKIPASLVFRLKNLDEEFLTKYLGGVLDEKRRRAILTRRDALLESAANNN